MGMRATDAYLMGVIRRQDDLVSKADTLEDGLKLMKTIRPFSQNIEDKV